MKNIDLKFNSILELLNTFSDQQTCIDYLEKVRWGNNVVSPFDADSKVYECKNNRYRCKNTGKYFNVKTGTMFDNTKIKLQSWFLAIWLLTSHKKGVSSIQLSKDINVTQKTAWFMLQRIRACFAVGSDDDLMNGEVEADETFIGGKNKNRHESKKVPNAQGRSTKDKTAVLGVLERGGDVKVVVAKGTSDKDIRPFIEENVSKDAKMFTDEWSGYNGVKLVYDVECVNHGEGKYVIGTAHTNTIEGFWAQLKRSIIGVYHHISVKHLQKYVDASAFRYNTRGMQEDERITYVLANCETRTTYKALIGARKKLVVPF